MTDEEIVAECQWAKRFAQKSRFYHLADDFSQWVAVHLLKTRKPKYMRYLWIDFLRSHYADLRTEHGRMKSASLLNSHSEVDLVNMEKLYVQNNHIADIDLPKFKKYLGEREYEIIRLYYFEDKTLLEIGKIYGVSESRISQQMKRAREKLKGAINRRTKWEDLNDVSGPK